MTSYGVVLCYAVTLSLCNLLNEVVVFFMYFFIEADLLKVFPSIL